LQTIALFPVYEKFYTKYIRTETKKQTNKQNEAYEELVNLCKLHFPTITRDPVVKKKTQPSWIVSEKEGKLQLLQR